MIIDVKHKIFFSFIKLLIFSRATVTSLSMLNHVRTLTSHLHDLEKTSIPDIQNCRRQFLSWSSRVAGQSAFLSGVGIFADVKVAKGGAVNEKPPDKAMIKLSSGLQFVEYREGTGPVVSENEIVILHLRALTSNDSVLFDSKREGTPIMHEFGSVQDFNYFGGDSAKRSKITIGVEDAILSRGMASWEGGFGKLDPMRQGSIRAVIAPGPMAYGKSGVSRFDAFQMKLDKPVPRDETLKYEIEILRCLDINVSIPSEGNLEKNETITIQACCTEENYPCKTPNT